MKKNGQFTLQGTYRLKESNKFRSSNSNSFKKECIFLGISLNRVFPLPTL